jgi:outer membrane protein assembly factor BamB
MIFIPSDAPLISTGIPGAPAVTALRSSDGTQLWSKSISHTTRTGGWPGAFSDPISGLPVVADGHVYVGLANTQGGIGMIVALRASDGRELWHRQIDHFNPRLIDRPLSAGDGMVFVAGIGALRAADGSLAWSGIADGAPVYHDSVVYINALFGPGPGTHIRALNARDGRELWTSDNLRGPDSAPRVIRTLGVGNDMVYVSLITAENGSQAYLAALDKANGTQRWLVPLPGEPEGTAASNGVIYVGTTGNLVALNAANGSSLWRQSTGSFVIYHQPQVAGDVVFVISTYNQPGSSPCAANCGEPDYINALSTVDGSFYWRQPLAWANASLAVA